MNTDVLDRVNPDLGDEMSMDGKRDQIAKPHFVSQVVAVVGTVVVMIMVAFPLHLSHFNPAQWRSAADCCDRYSNRNSATGEITVFDSNRRPRSVWVAKEGGNFIFEGDILLDRQPAALSLVLNVAIASDRNRWPLGRIPYEMDDNLRTGTVVQAAIKHWEEHTQIRFIPRTAINESRYPDYILFAEREGCDSYVGRRGGMQILSVASGCTIGQTIHEIGHAVGLWHEHTRKDRDRYVDVQWDNIQSGLEYNFNQHISDGEDLRSYDYASIMHYAADAFSRNGKPTLVPKGGQQIGQRDGLSLGDVLAVLEMYSPNSAHRPQARVVGRDCGSLRAMLSDSRSPACGNVFIR